jgi:hypothetical protein
MTERRLGAAIFVSTFAFFLLTSGRERPWGDANVQYMVAESLLDRGALDIPKPWPDDMPPDDQGRFYSTYPLLTSAVQIPGLLLFEGVAAADPGARTLARPLTSHLACSFFGALACFLFFRLCRQRKLGVAASSAATLVLAVATTVWVYAHYSYSEIAQAALFTGFLLALLRASEEPTAGHARWLGLWAGLLFSIKYIYAVSLVGAALFLLLGMRGRWREIARLAGWAALTAVPFLAAALVYNYLCWGSLLKTGYHPYFDQYWGENLLVGLWGVFLSPGKSALLYSPPLILGLLAIPLLLRRHRPLCLAALATGGPVLLLYARYKLNGDYAWGPRFAVFLVPVLGLSFAVLLDAWRRSGFTWPKRTALATTVAAGVLVQVLGNAFYWDHFIRISMDARTAWLGKPNRAGAIIPVRAGGHCDSCFEDVHQLQWLPPFQPILGHLWLLRSQLADHDWKQAEARAPWRRHTSLTLNISRSYPRVRLDWWGMLWLRDARSTRTAGLLLLLLFSAATVAGAILWLLAHRALREPPAPLPPSRRREV